MSSANKDRGAGHRGGDNKPEKKNDLKIQLSNHNKMAAYTQKNTFSAATTLPPPDNRLYIASNINKEQPPLWIKTPANDSSNNRGSFGDRSGPDSSGFERDHFAKMQMVGIGDLNLSGNVQEASGGSGAFKCSKCGIPGHFDFNCMNKLQLPTLNAPAIAGIPPLLQTKELLEYNLQVLKLQQKEAKREKALRKEEKKRRKEDKKKRKEAKKEKKDKKQSKSRRLSSRDGSPEHKKKHRKHEEASKEPHKKQKRSDDRRRSQSGESSLDQPKERHHQRTKPSDDHRGGHRDSHETSISSSSSDSRSGSSSSSKSREPDKGRSKQTSSKVERRHRSREHSKEPKDRKERR